MTNASTIRPRFRHFLEFLAIIALVCFACSPSPAQTPPAGQSPEVKWLEDIQKNPELLAALEKLAEKLQHGIPYPSARNASRLLPTVPEATIAYIALPNYGEMAHQALEIFHQELAESPALRDWWQHGPPAANGPELEKFLQKTYELSQYFGEELVVSVAMRGREPNFLILAEARKPGLKNLLPQMLNDLAGKTKPPVRVLDARELASAEDSNPGKDLLVLVRPDFVVASTDLAALRSFNAQLDRAGREFGSTPFGRRVARAYEGGVSFLGAVDLHQLVSLIPLNTKEKQITFQRTGFADLKYLVWDYRWVSGHGISRVELSFEGPRHGIASWLAPPAALGSLDFISPSAMIAGAAQLKSPAKMLDDVMDIASVSSPNAPASLAQMEKAMNINLKEDLLNLLGGEIAFELDDIVQKKPLWKTLLRVTDPTHLQQTLTTLLAMGNMHAQQSEDGGVTYYTVHVPSAKTPYDVVYAFADGYLIAAPSKDAVAEAIRFHRSDESLGKSQKFRAALPGEHASEASGVFYEDPIAVILRAALQEAPDVAASLGALAGKAGPLVVCAYAEDAAIREASTSVTYDAAAMLGIAAVAIPNLLRSRIAANEASAVGSVRTIDTAEITYSATYVERGYAPDLAALGPDPSAPTLYSAGHAGLLDQNLANATCTGGAWCTKSGYRFMVTAVCKEKSCSDFVAVATPVSSDTGTRNFCSTSDGLVRFQVGPPLSSPVSIPECKTWPPLQ